jgi:hypothetical protein
MDMKIGNKCHLEYLSIFNAIENLNILFFKTRQKTS